MLNSIKKENDLYFTIFQVFVIKFKYKLIYILIFECRTFFVDIKKVCRLDWSPSNLEKLNLNI